MKKTYEQPYLRIAHVKSDYSILTGSIDFGGVNNQNGESTEDFIKNGATDDVKPWYHR